jgi:hypothetical protein
MMVPNVVDIENVRGYCNAQCHMCTISAVEDKKIMTLQECELVLHKLSKYLPAVSRLQFVGFGEPTLDKGLCEKIACAKRLGFTNIGLVSNGSASTEDYIRFIESGLDFVLFSVDSIVKEVYEAIRLGLRFETIIENVMGTIAYRNASHSKCRIFVRSITSERNAHLLSSYTEHWTNILDIAGGDLILSFPQHNWADSPEPIEKSIPCPYPFEHMTINAHGFVQFCCIDVKADFIRSENAFQVDPINAFNNGQFVKARNVMKSGRINDLIFCRHCNLPIIRTLRRIRTESS